MNKFCPTFVFVFLLAVCASGQAVSKATIQGVLLKSTGKPLPYTEIELVPVWSEQVINDSKLIGVSSANGKFTFFDVPPGKYTLSINFHDMPTKLSPYETCFYPTTKDRSEAQVFEIDESTRLRGLTFKLLPALVPRVITGTVVNGAGEPVPGALVACVDMEFDWGPSFRIVADAKGAFKAEGFVGRRYQLGAIILDKPMIIGEPPPNVIAVGESMIFDLAPDTKPFQIKVKFSDDMRSVYDKYLG